MDMILCCQYECILILHSQSWLNFSHVFFFFLISWSKNPSILVASDSSSSGTHRGGGPLATGEAPLGVIEEESLTFMIEGVLDELSPEIETTEACGDGEEEKGWSSTLGKDDNESNDANDEVKPTILLINKSRPNKRNKHQLRSRACRKRIIERTNSVNRRQSSYYSSSCSSTTTTSCIHKDSPRLIAIRISSRLRGLVLPSWLLKMREASLLWRSPGHI